MSRRLDVRPWALLAIVLAAGCQGGGQSQAPPATGAVLPTVSGRDATAFGTGDEAMAAFTRSCGSVVATLEDAAWLRYQGDPQTVAQQHRAYFDYGYTTFEVVLFAREFMRPTEEVFVLEDSLGARLTGSPTCFETTPRLEGQRWTTDFPLSFPHVLTAEVRWIRLTRQTDGSSVEWRFEEPPPAPPEPPPCVRGGSR